MPRSKTPANYPDQFGQLVQHAVTRLVRIPLEDEKAARALMGRLYAYHGALKWAAHQATCDEDTRALAGMAVRVQYRVEGNVLIARPQDMDPDGKRILDALKLPTGEPAPTELGPSESLLQSLATLTPKGASNENQ